MAHRIGMSIVCLHISAVLYGIVGVGMMTLIVLTNQEDAARTLVGVVLLVFCLLLSVGVEAVVYGLKRRRFWAWVAALCIFGVFVPSVFLPLGALGLWGLLDRDSRQEFGVDGEPPSRDQ